MKKRRPGAPVKLTRATIASFQAVCAHGFSGCFSGTVTPMRSEEHTSELQSQSNLVCRLLLEKKKTDAPNVKNTHHPNRPSTPPLFSLIRPTRAPDTSNHHAVLPHPPPHPRPLIEPPHRDAPL